MRRTGSGVVALCICLWGAKALASISITQAPAVNVAPHQVTIWWRTDVSGTTEVHYGPSSANGYSDYPNHSVFSNSAGTLHSRTLSSLAPGTYYFRVRSALSSSVAATSVEGSFAVPPLGDTTPLGNLVFNGPVLALAQAGSVVYAAGSFTEVGVRRGASLGVDGATGALLPDQPQVAGLVDAVVPDGAGGFFIGGDFSAVGGLVRNHAAHILADGGVDPYWHPDLNKNVNTLAVSGSTVYLGGAFTLANGTTTRNYAAAVDNVTGLVAAWNPNLNQSVYTLAVSGSTVYLGGLFTTAGGTARSHAAAVDAASGALRAWNPDLNDSATLIESSGSTIYLGGLFTTANGTVVRNRVAAVDATSGVLTSWDADLNERVEALVVSGSTIYLAGFFTTANGTVVRNRAAAVDAASGDLLSWDPNLNDRVYELAVSGAAVYLGGDFTTANGGVVRNRAAAVDAASGDLLSWDPNLNNKVEALAVSGSTVYLGGSFTTANGGMTRNYAAAVDAVSGTLSSWDANMNGSVWALAVSGSTVYLGGRFSTANGGTTRRYAAAVDAVSGVLSPWNPDININGMVSALAVFGSTVYLGGDFTTVNGAVMRNRAAAVDASSAALTPWNPNTNSPVRALAASNSIAYLGGTFTTVNGATARRYAAAVDAVSGTLTSWDPRFNGAVAALSLNCRTGRLAVGGSFTSTEVASQSGLAVFQTGLACAGTLPDITDQQPGDLTWRNTNSGLYDVHFSDAEALAAFDVQVRSEPMRSGTQLQDWTEVSTLLGTSYASPWALPDSTWAAMREGLNHVSVRVRDGDANERETRDAFFVRKDTIPPPPVTTLSAPPRDSTPTLSWTAVADATSGVAFYRVYRSNSDAGPWTQISLDGEVSNASYVDQSANPNELSYYKVQAVDLATTEQTGGANVVMVTGVVMVSGPSPRAFQVGCGCNGAIGPGQLAFALLAWLACFRRWGLTIPGAR